MNLYDFTLNYTWLVQLIWVIITLVGTFAVIRLATLLVTFIIKTKHHIDKNQFFRKGGESTRTSKIKTIRGILKSLFSYIGWTICLFIIMAIYGVDIAVVLSGAGLIGIVVGFGLKDMLSDIFSGLFIIIEDHFAIDDVVEVDGFRGTVVELGVKTTRLKSWDGQVMIVANRNFQKVKNLTLSETSVAIKIYIDPESDYAKAEKIISKVITAEWKKSSAIKAEPVMAGIDEMDSEKMTIMFFIKTEPYNYFAARRMLKTEIYQALSKNKILMPRSRMAQGK